ncbi:MAG: hypothetical protein NZX77_10575, partial [Polyangiaceae bacterium]|nr:hypothetical protein [Polyangiaceae bacterium]
FVREQLTNIRDNASRANAIVNDLLTFARQSTPEFAERDLREAVWRAYKNVFLLAEDNSLRKIDLGLVHSSAASSLVDLILSHPTQEDIVVDSVSPNFLTRYWPPALPEWSTKSVRDAFYASPRFPRLLKPDAVKDTISRGLDAGTIAYVSKAADGSYEPFIFKRPLAAADIEIADNVYLIARERAEEYLAKKAAPTAPTCAPQATTTPTGPTGRPAPTGRSRAPRRAPEARRRNRRHLAPRSPAFAGPGRFLACRECRDEGFASRSMTLAMAATTRNGSQERDQHTSMRGR